MIIIVIFDSLQLTNLRHLLENQETWRTGMQLPAFTMLSHVAIGPSAWAKQRWERSWVGNLRLSTCRPSQIRLFFLSQTLADLYRFRRLGDFKKSFRLFRLWLSGEAAQFGDRDKRRNLVLFGCLDSLETSDDDTEVSSTVHGQRLPTPTRAHRYLGASWTSSYFVDVRCNCVYLYYLRRIKIYI